VPFPTCIIDQRTGQPSLAVELLSLEGTVRIADFRQVCGSPGWRRETLLGGTERPGWALESDQCFVIKVSARCNFREIGAANSLSAIWARWTRSGAGECTGYLWEWLLAPPSPIESFERPSPAPSVVSGQPAATPAEELRSITRLAPAILARIFGVSRSMYYRWVEGAIPRDERFQHLLDVLTHVKDAEKKLPSSIDFTAWLRTPISPGGRNPLDLLERKRFSTFRGLIVRARSSEMHLSTPLPSALSAATRRTEGQARLRERISPSPRIEDDDSVEPGQGGGYR